MTEKNCLGRKAIQQTKLENVSVWVLSSLARVIPYISNDGFCDLGEAMHFVFYLDDVPFYMFLDNILYYQLPLISTVLLRVA